MLAIGYYMGGGRPTKGQRRQTEILFVVRANTWAEGLTVEERQDRLHQYPYIRLLEKFGVRWNDKVAAVFEAFERMANGFSESYRADLLELLEECGFASVKSAADALMENISATA